LQIPTLQVHATGNIRCTNNKTGGRYPLENVKVRLMEYDKVGAHDVEGEMLTNKRGEFDLTGSSKEWWDDRFFVWIEFPCGLESTDACAEKEIMCKNPKCTY
ncbi:hypothetical protein PMAYCL1PPCAC_05750, partial [Pristionchus mayeri]